MSQRIERPLSVRPGPRKTTCPPSQPAREPLIYWQPVAATALVVIAAALTLVLTLPGSKKPEAAEEVARKIEPSSGPVISVVLPAKSLPLPGPKVAVPPAEASPLVMAPLKAPSVEVPPLDAPGPAEKSVAKTSGPEEETTSVVKPGPGPDFPVASIRVPEPPALDSLPPLLIEDAPAKEVTETFGTAVTFSRNLVLAKEAAKKERKLLFVLHVSGNFEDSGFT